MSPEPEPEYRRNASLLETELKDSDFLPKGEKTIAEPLPEWSKAIKVWGVAWEFHQYGLGAVYALLFFMISMWLWKRIRRVLTGNQGNKVPIIVLSLLGFFCLTRSLCLCTDAYHWRKITPVAFVNVLWGIGQPCLIAAYTLFFIVMRNALTLKQHFQQWYNTRNIAIATLPYFIFALAAELTLLFVPAYKGLTFTCQLLYILFGVSLTVFYAIISVLLWKRLSISKNQWATDTTRARGKRTRAILRTCIAAAFGGLSICAMQFYAMTSVYGVFSNARSVPAWPWWAFQTTFRVIEICMVAILCYAVNDRGVDAKKGEIAPSSIVSETPFKPNVVEMSEQI